jgi:hypothetical protein
MASDGKRQYNSCPVQRQVSLYRLYAKQRRSALWLNVPIKRRSHSADVE